MSLPLKYLALFRFDLAEFSSRTPSHVTKTHQDLTLKMCLARSIDLKVSGSWQLVDLLGLRQRQKLLVASSVNDVEGEDFE